MKNVLTAIVALGLVVTPLSLFNHSLSVAQAQTEENKDECEKENEEECTIVPILLSAALFAIVLSSSSQDEPVSP